MSTRGLTPPPTLLASIASTRTQNASDAMTAETRLQLPLDQPSADARLVFVDVDGLHEVELSHTPLILGAPGASRVGYARIEHEAGCYTLTPMLPAAPDLVNGRPLLPHQRVTLTDGDTITYATQTARFEQRVEAHYDADTAHLDGLRSMLTVAKPSARRSPLRIPLTIALVAVVAIAGYAAQRNRSDTGSAGATPGVEQNAVLRGSAAPAFTPVVPTGLRAGAFDVGGAGSGRVEIPAPGPQFTVRVSISPDAPPPGTWFWCFGADFGIPPDARYCSSSGVFSAQTVRLISERLISIDPAWPPAARYHVQLYCDHPACAWDVEVVPSP